MSGVYGTAIVRKLDNGYRGVILNKSSRGLFKEGDEIFNRQLHPFPRGSTLRVTISFSAKGRRMVKAVALYEGEVKWSEHYSSAAVLHKKTADKVVEATVTFDPASSKSALHAIFDPTGTEPLPKTGIEKMVEDMIEIPTIPATFEDIVTAMVEKEEEIAVADAKTVTKNSRGYFVSREGRLVFNTALEMSKNAPNTAVKVMMVGQSGYGKTTLPRLFAELAGKRFMRMNCATVRDPEEWFGYREAVGGSTQFVRSQFASALEAGNLVVVLDEFNRLEPWLHNTLFPLLDDDGCTVVHDEKFSIGPGVIVVGTINTGYKYTGTFELDEALMNRFEFVLEVGPMPFEDEVGVLITRTGVGKDTAEQVVKVANILRQAEVVCSTRTSLLIAKMVVSGLLVREAFETAVVKRIPVDSSGSALRKQVVDLINVELGPFEERRLGVDIFSVPEDAPVIKTHRLTMCQGDRGINKIRVIKLLKELDTTDGIMSLLQAKNYAEDLMRGETIVLELKGKPDNLAEFTSAGVSGRYTSYTI